METFITKRGSMTNLKAKKTETIIKFKHYFERPYDDYNLHLHGKKTKPFVIKVLTSTDFFDKLRVLSKKVKEYYAVNTKRFNQVNKDKLGQTIFWLVESIFRIGVGIYLCGQHNTLLFIAGIWAILTGVLVVIYNFYQANN